MQTLVKWKQNGYVNIRQSKVSKVITGDREWHHIMTKGSIHQKDIAILNLYALHNSAAKYVKWKLIKLKGKRQVHDYSWSFQQPYLKNWYNWTENQDIAKINNIINQQDPTDIFLTLQQTIAEHMFFSTAQKIYPEINLEL